MTRCGLPALLIFLALCFSSTCFAQSESSRRYSRANTFGIFAEFSNDSSHILMGTAENRKLAAIGVTYARRLWSSKAGDLRYVAEVRPLLMESDPTSHATGFATPIDPAGPSYPLLGDSVPYLACKAGNTEETVKFPRQTILFNWTVTCGRRWTFAQGFSPAGLQYSFLRGHRIRPFITWTGGYVFSTRPIPTPEAGSFNFTFDFGAGLEFFRRNTRSMQFEYRFHHISNKDTATNNPGIDNGVFRLSYAFGR